MQNRRHGARALAAVGLVVVVLSLSGCLTKDQTTDFNYVNGTRKAHSLALLKADDKATAKAQAWARHMAGTGVLEHTGGGSTVNPAPLTGWCQYAENVGRASSILNVHTDFLASPTHYANMTGPYDRVGIGVYKKGSTYWVAEIYLKTRC